MSVDSAAIAGPKNMVDIMRDLADSLKNDTGAEPAGFSGETPDLLDATVGAFFDRKPDDMFPQASAPEQEELVQLDDVQMQLDTVQDMGNWKPPAEISKHQATTTNTRDESRKEANRVETAESRIEQVGAAEKDLEKFIQQVEEGKSQLPAADAQSPDGKGPGGASKLATGFAASAGTAAFVGAVGGPKALAALTAFEAVRVAKKVMDYSNSDVAVKAEGAGTGTRAAAQANSFGEYASKSEKNEGYHPQASAPQQGVMTAGVAAAKPADNFGKVPTDDVIYNVTNAGNSLGGVARCHVEQHPTIMAMREDIKNMKAEFGQQRDMGLEQGAVLKDRIENGVDLAKVNNLGNVGSKAREEFARTGSTISFSA